MSDHDWFSNRTWNEEIEARFWAKFKRARTWKSTALEHQASHISDTHPEIALRLLDEYFKLPEDGSPAFAWYVRGDAYSALGNFEEAFAAYNRALEVEAEQPHLRTPAYLSLSVLVATRGMSEHNSRAVEVLDANIKRVVLPLDHFLWNASHALIARSLQRNAEASDYARRALAAAAAQTSGLRYHPHFQLVDGRWAPVIHRLEALVRAT